MSKALILETVVKRLHFLVVIIEVMPRAQNTHVVGGPPCLIQAVVVGGTY